MLFGSKTHQETWGWVQSVSRGNEKAENMGCLGKLVQKEMAELVSGCS